MDNFLDVIVVRKNKGLYSLLYFFASLLMIVLAMVVAIFVFRIISQDESGMVSFDYISLIITVVAGGLAFLLYWSRAFIRIDYDISFTNGFVEIARVANNIRRKELCRFYMKEVEAGGYTTDPSFKRYDSMKEIKRYKAVLNRGAKVFYLFVVVADKKALVTFEVTDDELLKLMNHYNQRNVKI